MLFLYVWLVLYVYVYLADLVLNYCFLAVWLCYFSCYFRVILFIRLCSSFFFFKQKTAYDMRISDWSSDVCSSDLAVRRRGLPDRAGHLSGAQQPDGAARADGARLDLRAVHAAPGRRADLLGIQHAHRPDGAERRKPDDRPGHRAAAARRRLRFRSRGGSGAVLRAVPHPIRPRHPRGGGEPPQCGTDGRRRQAAERQCLRSLCGPHRHGGRAHGGDLFGQPGNRSEEHTSELKSLMRSSYAVFCLQKKRLTKYHAPQSRQTIPI